MPKSLTPDTADPHRPQENFLRPMGVGELLDGAFRLYRRHLFDFATVGLILYLPAMVVAFPAPLAGMALQFLAYGLQVVAILWLAARAILGEPLERGRAIRFAFANLIPYAIGGLVWFVLLGVVVGVASLVAAPFVAADQAFLAALGALLAAPLVALAMVRLHVWRQVLLLERDWSFLGRSMRLTRRAFWRVLAVVFFGFLLVGIPAAIAQVSTLYAGDQLEAFGTQEMIVTPPSVTLVSCLVSAIVQPFALVLSTLLYYELRVRSEGYDVDLEAQAFEAALNRDSGD